MTERYGRFTEFGRIIFPILRDPSDYHHAPARREDGPVPLFFEAEELPTKAGRIVPDGLAANGYAVRADEAGAVVHGPYLAYPPGEYAVEFRVRIAPGARPGVVGHVDVAGQAGRDVLARRDLAITGARSARDYRDIPVHVVVHRAEPLEFRVVSQGIQSIWVDRIRVRLSHVPPERVER